MAKRSSVEDFIIDFSKEESGGGGGVRYKPGTYPVRILAAKPTVSENKGTHGLTVTFQFTEGKLKGKKLSDTLWASPKAYSRFRTLLEACGKKVPQKVNLIRIAKAIKGAELYIEVDDEEREGYKARSRVSFNGFISVDDFDPDDVDDEDDEDLDDDELDDDDDDLEEDDDDEEDDGLDDLDRAELKAYIKKNKLDVTVKKSMDDDDIVEAIREAQDEDDEEEEDEEPEPPKRKRAAKKAPAKKSRRKKAADDEDDDLDDLDLDDL